MAAPTFTPADIYHRILGRADAEPLVMVHGIDSSATFLSIADRLQWFYRLVLYDQRGHGRTPAVGDDYSLDRMVADLAMLLDFLQLGKVHLLGHSAGGKTALLFADRHPERVQSLIVEEIGIRGSNLGEKEAYLRKFSASQWPRRLFEFESLSADLRESLGRLKVPVLFQYAGQRGEATVKSLNPNARVDCIIGASHAIHESHPVEFAESLRRFTDSVSD